MKKIGMLSVLLIIMTFYCSAHELSSGPFWAVCLEDVPYHNKKDTSYGTRGVYQQYELLKITEPSEHTWGLSRTTINFLAPLHKNNPNSGWILLNDNIQIFDNFDDARIFSFLNTASKEVIDEFYSIFGDSWKLVENDQPGQQKLMMFSRYYLDEDMLDSFQTWTLKRIYKHSATQYEMIVIGVIKNDMPVHLAIVDSEIFELYDEKQRFKAVYKKLE